MKNCKEIGAKAESPPASGIAVPGIMSTEDALALIHELQISRVELELQNQTLLNSQAQNEEQQRKYRELFESAPVGYLTLDRRGIVLEANETAARQLGVEKSFLLYRPISLFTVREDRAGIHAHVRQTVKSGKRQTMEVRLETKGGAERAAQVDCVPFQTVDGAWLCRTTLTDITARRQAEAALRDAHDALVVKTGVQSAELLMADGRIEHEVRQRERIDSLYRANNTLLHLLARSLSRKDYCDALVEQILAWSECRCAGFRIMDGRGGIPYESYAGFSREFWESENAILLESDRCACTRVAAGKLEPQDACSMTPAGSFCCNDTTEFVAGLSEMERQAFRGVCMVHGYRSLALIPIHCDAKILGLVQLADERPGMVPSSLVEFLESLAPLIGEAIRRFELKEALRQNFEAEGMLNELLCMALEDVGLEAVLAKSLEMLFAIPWLPLEPSGRICLTGKKPGQPVREGDPRVFAAKYPPGDTGKSSRAALAPKGEEYGIPLASREGPLGVVHLRLKKGNKLLARDEAFFSALANVLVSIVRHRRAEEDLQESGRRLRILSSRLLTAQEEERKRIARELHDSIGASLSAMKLGLQRVLTDAERGAAVGESLRTMVSISQQSIEETRRIVNDLRPAVLDDLGILPAITWFCRNFQEVSGVGVETVLGVEEGDVPERLRTAVFRIVQEGMNNIAKHSGATRMKLSLLKTAGGLELTIEDNGRGCDVDAVRLREDGRGGMGLAGMRERTELAGGVFSITSTPGEGTTIRALWPVTAAAPP